MNTLQKIDKKDPSKIADDDHLERKDISKKEALEAFRLIGKGMKKKKGKQKPSEFSKALVDSFNEL